MNMPEAIHVLGDVALPHCDQSVLHAPGECQYCDQHPDWQALRAVWGVAFTGHTPQADQAKVPCPSDFVRGTGGAHVWPGNQPTYDTSTDPR
jgi:hypothetical protein